LYRYTAGLTPAALFNVGVGPENTLENLPSMSAPTAAQIAEGTETWHDGAYGFMHKYTDEMTSASIKAIAEVLKRKDDELNRLTSAARFKGGEGPDAALAKFQQAYMAGLHTL
jgi:hypothetical protein